MSHKTIGLFGGTTPESTIGYYQYITGQYTRRFDDYGYPQVLIYSVTFQEFLDWGRSDRWDLAAAKMAQAFEALRRAGADFGLMTANTPHLVFDEVARQTSLPLISIVQTTQEAILRADVQRVALLGTETTMTASFYPDALGARGIGTLVPTSADRRLLSRIIYEELARGEIRPDSKRECLRIVGELRERGAEGIILGCTELPLILHDDDVELPLFDTLEIHAEEALRMAVGPAWRDPA
jgi:aspartate racemase